MQDDERERLSRRELLKRGAATAGAMSLGLVPRAMAEPRAELIIGGQPMQLSIAEVSDYTARILVQPLVNGQPVLVPVTGALERDTIGRLVVAGRDAAALARTPVASFDIRVTDGPPRIRITDTARGSVVQELVFDAAAPGMSFLLPQGPLLGLGEGGAQFDRKGTIDQMQNGQGARQDTANGQPGYLLATHGTRAPVQWLVGTDGWGMFIHQPYGSFDFTGTVGRFTPRVAGGPAAAPAPYDIFIVASQDPRRIMFEYARITGVPEMPARWTFGYQQSHRTLDGGDGILAEARKFREKKLPCDTMIYLGTEFTPSGWNTRNGEFTWHPTNFPDPKGMLDELHTRNFKVVMHIVVEGRRLEGKVTDACTAAPLPPGRVRTPRTSPDGAAMRDSTGQQLFNEGWPPDRQVSCYWPAHRALMETGVDGWWPDQGDGFDGPSRFNRHRMYWEGTQQIRPNERPFALHRNASPGIQRYGGFIWSGDVQTRWETLKTHVPIAINTGLSGLPYWGTDIGGFNPTAEYTGELHVRWFQFGAFCPSFRAHGRNWHLRLPWGWDGGDGGPPGDNGYRMDPTLLNDKEVEPIVKKYLELRSRLTPYLYTTVRDAHESGLPIMRALWLHYPDDPTAVARRDQYLWGPNILVAPVVEKGATTRSVYLPRGAWIDFWTERQTTGGREISRPVDLATMPLYVRCGSVIPMGPVRQYSEEPTTEPMELVVYPGTNGISSFYDDDGHTFNHRQGEWTRWTMEWQDNAGRLIVRLAPGSRMHGPARRPLRVRVAGISDVKMVEFTGQPLDVRFF